MDPRKLKRERGGKLDRTMAGGRRRCGQKEDPR